MKFGISVPSRSESIPTRWVSVGYNVNGVGAIWDWCFDAGRCFFLPLPVSQTMPACPLTLTIEP